RLLDELRVRLGESDALGCPACYPMSASVSGALRQTNQSQRPIYHPCSGKHLGHLLVRQARGQELADYLGSSAPLYGRLKQLLALVSGQPVDEETVDGCGMPNYPLSMAGMARLFAGLQHPLAPELAAQAPDELQPLLGFWPEVSRLMRAHPELVGGSGR